MITQVLKGRQMGKTSQMTCTVCIADGLPPVDVRHRHYRHSTRTETRCAECHALLIGDDLSMLITMLEEHWAVKHPPRDFQDDDAYRAHWEPA